MKLHPYTDVPYMQAYDPVVLQCERYSHQLIRRLLPEDSPTFSNYQRNPPASALDLGCGAGLWLLDAARMWRTTQFVGFDLVDVVVPALTDGSVPNVRLVRGDFLNYALPFAKDQFELVRMANLSLCVPYKQWDNVLREVHRVLAPGGRLELLDDQTVFPYGDVPAEEAPDMVPDTLTTIPQTSAHPCDPDVPVSSPSTAAPVSDSAPTTPSTISTELADEEEPVEVSTGPWSTKVTAARDLERVFSRMLATQYGMHTHPAELMPPLLARIFVEEQAQTGHVEPPMHMHLKLAPVGAAERPGVVVQGAPERRGSWLAGPPNSNSMPSTPTPNTLSHVRGGSTASTASVASALSTASMSSVTSGAWFEGMEVHRPLRFATERVQHPGLILWPATFIPVPPQELEMHATKHMQTLLGCKPALAEFVATFTDPETGARLVSEEGFEEALWEYECFRRERLNWPELPESRLEDDEMADLLTPASTRSAHHQVPRTPTADTDSSSLQTTVELFGRFELTHVRSLRVFSAIKGAAPSASMDL
ncbi:hypothetical protein GGX14DRAFT_371477 [Mycena pura]|uniref:Methyltransferase domain-containing protein n=1 Tax=Mycena pura TaxID=153505 RepID=A0AAD6V3E7_9AGAR|nr:hypothetical protein GGX14DRAFT_371477 [Mycena pura]